MTFNSPYPESMNPAAPAKSEEGEVRIVQYADENKTLPDGSQIIYAESSSKIVLYKKKPMESPVTYLYERNTGKIFLNGEEGSKTDKKSMLDMGKYLLTHSKESELVTICVQKS